MAVTQDLFSRVEAMRQQSAKREAALLEAKRQKADDNRRKMPTVAGWVDQVRAVFVDAQVVFASEGGITFGQPSPAGVQPGGTAAFVQRGRGRRA